jgi:hypothetical protein
MGKNLVGPMGFESASCMETKEFCGAARPSKVLKGKDRNWLLCFDLLSLVFPHEFRGSSFEFRVSSFLPLAKTRSISPTADASAFLDSTCLYGSTAGGYAVMNESALNLVYSVLRYTLN